MIKEADPTRPRWAHPSTTSLLRPPPFLEVTMQALLAVLLLALLSFPLSASESRVRPLFRTFITGGSGNVCTTFSVHKAKHLWMTAAHCIQDGGAYQIGSLLATPLTVNPEWDLALLVVEGGPHVGALRIGRRPFQGQPIHMYGHPFGFNDQVLFRGFVAAPSVSYLEEDGTVKSVILLDMVAGGGNSGSPVLDEEGEVVSVLSLGYGGWGAGAYPFSGGVLWERVKAFWPR